MFWCRDLASCAVGEGHDMDLASRLSDSGVCSPPNVAHQSPQYYVWCARNLSRQCMYCARNLRAWSAGTKMILNLAPVSVLKKAKMLTCGCQVLLAWTGDLGQDRFAMLAHQCILDHYVPASTLIRIGFNRSRCCLWCARDVRVKAQPEPKPLDVKKPICS